MVLIYFRSLRDYSVSSISSSMTLISIVLMTIETGRFRLRRDYFQKRWWRMPIPVGQKSLIEEVEDIATGAVTGSKRCPNPFAPATPRFTASSLCPVFLTSGDDRSPRSPKPMALFLMARLVDVDHSFARQQRQELFVRVVQ